ncbi:MAG: type II toxin-antitoxin system RelB/DinJ family antitoxin [Blastocatellia bacterium]|nr:type II toxin-antitoxin system RelB/DinJ family antitoxin [Blastocatellia bacterium]
MSKTAMIRARIEPTLKEETEKILETLGLSVSEAITLFYKQITFQKALPFDVKIPNEVTIAAIQDALDEKDLNYYSTLSDLRDKLASENK